MASEPSPRARNKAAITDEIVAGRTRVATQPFEIQFSPEHRCNLECVQCIATIQRNHGEIPLMDRRLPQRALERFRKIAPNLSLWEWLSLTGGGEPLLSPDFPAIAGMTRGHDCHVLFNTNGTIMNRRLAEMLVTSEIDEVHFSIDGGCKETFERVRVKARWEKVLRNIRTLATVKRELGARQPKLVFSGNFMRQNIEDLPRIVDLAAAMDVPQVNAHNTAVPDPSMADEALANHRPLARRMVIEAMARARAAGVTLWNYVIDLSEEDEEQVAVRERVLAREAPPIDRFILADVASGAARLAESDVEAAPGGSAEPELTEGTTVEEDVVAVVQPGARIDPQLAQQVEPPDDLEVPGYPDDEAQSIIPTLPLPADLPAIVRACQRPWTGLFVENDGSVRVCCFDSPLIGNLDEQSLPEIWNGLLARDLRRSFLESDPPESCRSCFIFAKYRDREDVLVQKTVRSGISNIDAPSVHSPVNGMCTVVGWALDRSGVETVEILLDGKKLADAEYGHSRPDVAEVHPGFPDGALSGFQCTFDTDSMAPGDHRLRLRIRNRNGETELGAYRPIVIAP